MQFRWNKLGRIFDPSTVKDVPWLKDYAQAPDTLIFDDFVRVYFSCRPDKDANGNFVSYTAFVDLDRKNLFNIINMAKEPVMPLGRLGEFDEFGIYPITVFREYDYDQVRAYYGGWTRGFSTRYNTSIGLAFSYDEGEHFTKYGEGGPVLSYSLYEPFNLGSMKIRKYNGTWFLFYVAGTRWKVVNGVSEPTYKIRVAISEDGENWMKYNHNLIKSVLEEDEAQSGPDVFFYRGQYHMFFCYRRSVDYRGKEGGLRIGYAHSKDLFKWNRDDSKAGITVSEEGWDSEMVRYPHVFELDGKVYMLYNGNDFGRTGFGLAIMEE